MRLGGRTWWFTGVCKQTASKNGQQMPEGFSIVMKGNSQALTEYLLTLIQKNSGTLFREIKQIYHENVHFWRTIGLKQTKTTSSDSVHMYAYVKVDASNDFQISREKQKQNSTKI